MVHNVILPELETSESTIMQQMNIETIFFESNHT